MTAKNPDLTENINFRVTSSQKERWIERAKGNYQTPINVHTAELAWAAFGLWRAGFGLADYHTAVAIAQG